MARTVIEIATEAAERDATAPAPATLFGTNDRIARIMRHALKDTMREYLRQSNWQGMSEFHSTWAFTLMPNRFAYALPPDFLRLIPNTQQRNGWPLGLLGPATPVTWARWLSGVAGVTAPMGWRIKNNLLLIEPVPDEAELVTIEYVSRYPVVSDIAEGDYDLSTTPPRITSPLVPRDGQLTLDNPKEVLPQSSDDAVYGSLPGYENGTYGPDLYDELRRLNPFTGISPPPQVRRPEFTADTDRPAFEDDYLLSLGMTFRLRKALGLPYAEHAAEYEHEMHLKLSADAGGDTGFRVGYGDIDADVMPLGGGKWALS